MYKEKNTDKLNLTTNRTKFATSAEDSLLEIFTPHMVISSDS